jgi:hypothetical protein
MSKVLCDGNLRVEKGNHVIRSEWLDSFCSEATPRSSSPAVEVTVLHWRQQGQPQPFL